MDATAPRPPFSWITLSRTLLGLILAPVIGGAIGTSILMIPELVADPSELAEFDGLLLFGAYFGAIFGILPALLLGLPIHLGLLRQGWTSIWAYVGLGALLGMGGFWLTMIILG